jgi:hypothetical protein
MDYYPLDLYYFVRYVFKIFPKRKKEILGLLHKMKKEYTVVHSYSQAEDIIQQLN